MYIYLGIIIIPRLRCSLRAKAYQLTAGLTCTCLQIEVKYHQANLRVTCGQHDESPGVVDFLD